MPEGLPPALWDATNGKVNEPAAVKSVIELSKFKSEYDTRMAAVPEKPEGYKLELPTDFAVPTGMQVTFDDKDPRVAAARLFAKEHGLGQDAFSKMLAFDAQQKVADFNTALANIEAEQKKLGEKFPEREKALTTFVASTLTGTNEQKSAKHAALQRVLTDAAAFEALEDIINKVGGSRIPGPGPQDPPKPPEQPLTDRWYGAQQKVS